MPLVGGRVTQRTLVKCGQRMMAMIGHQTNLSPSRHWQSVAKKWCPLLEDFVSLRTSTKCGPNCAPHWRTLSCSGVQPNVAQIVPLIGGLCHAADFYQMWSEMCPLSEDFVSLQTLNKCTTNCSPHRRTLSCSGFQPNVAQILPLIGGLCHAADFDQMWSKMCLLLEDFVSLWTLTKCGPNICPSLDDFVTQQTLIKCGPHMCPLTEDFVLLQSSTTYGSTTYSSSKKSGTKQTDSNHWLTWNWNRHLRLHCHVINTLIGICTNKPWQRNDGSHIHHAKNDKWHGLHTTITNTASYLMREESILIVFTWTSWRFVRAYAGLLVDATMMVLFVCRNLEQNSIGGANANNNKSWPKSLIVSDYSRMWRS